MMSAAIPLIEERAVFYREVALRFVLGPPKSGHLGSVRLPLETIVEALQIMVYGFETTVWRDQDNQKI